MNKKHVSIIGSCVSREILNDPRLQDIFDIDLYAFRICPWSIFDKNLNLSKDIINKAANPEFLNRNLEYGLNKSLIKHLEDVKSDIVMVDLFTLIFKILKVQYNNMSTYVQTDHIEKTSENLQKIFKTKNINLKFKIMDIEEISASKIETGLKKLANYLNENYENIVFVWPVLAKKYFGVDNNIHEYSENTINTINKKQEIVDKYSSMFINYLPKAQVIHEPIEGIARFISGDFSKNPVGEPSPVHYIYKYKEAMATKLLEILNIDYKEFYTRDLSSNDLYNEMIKNKYEKLESFKTKSFNQIICNINAYTNFLKKLKHHVIVISARDEASKLLKYYFNRFSLGVKFNIKYRDSYIAVIDTKNNFVYEKSSNEAIEYLYKIPNSNDTIYVRSQGYNAKSLSTIVYRNEEMSKNKRGLNFFVLDLYTNTIIDSATCDTNGDEFLLVDSNYFSGFNI